MDLPWPEPGAVIMAAGTLFSIIQTNSLGLAAGGGMCFPGPSKPGMFLSSVQGRIYSVSREAHPATGCCTRLEVRFVSAQRKVLHPLPPLPAAGYTNVPERSAPASFLPGPSRLRRWDTSAEYDRTSGQPRSDRACT